MCQTRAWKHSAKHAQLGGWQHHAQCRNNDTKAGRVTQRTSGHAWKYRSGAEDCMLYNCLAISLPARTQARWQDWSPFCFEPAAAQKTSLASMMGDGREGLEEVWKARQRWPACRSWPPPGQKTTTCQLRQLLCHSFYAKARIRLQLRHALNAAKGAHNLEPSHSSSLLEEHPCDGRTGQNT